MRLALSSQLHDLTEVHGMQDPAEARWARLVKTTYTDPTGVERTWESGERQVSFVSVYHDLLCISRGYAWHNTVMMVQLRCKAVELMQDKSHPCVPGHELASLFAHVLRECQTTLIVSSSPYQLCFSLSSEAAWHFICSDLPC